MPRRHTLYTNLALQRLEAKLKVDWPKQIVFVQNALQPKGFNNIGVDFARCLSLITYRD